LMYEYTPLANGISLAIAAFASANACWAAPKDVAASIAAKPASNCASTLADNSGLKSSPKLAKTAAKSYWTYCL
jgi:hypothetical protein